MTETATRTPTTIAHLAEHEGREVTLHGWLYNKRDKGKLQFLRLRDGSGLVQAVAVKGQLPDASWDAASALTQESSVSVSGTVKADSRAPGGFELSLTEVVAHQIVQGEYPIGPKEHGVDFLMSHRHLWLRSRRQHAILRIRSTIAKAMRDFMDEREYVLTDSPILTPAACEGTSTLFETEYFDEGKAYLTQSGQLYLEADAMAFGKVYCFGPTFRAEKSKTRRHLTEFWMLEAETAYCDVEQNMKLQEDLVAYVVARVLAKHRDELLFLERDVTRLEKVTAPFPRITYDEALKILEGQGITVKWGDDFGATDETVLTQQFDKPVFVTRYPAQCKAFYMEPAPDRPEVVLCADLLAPEGYGEVIGGSQRISDLALLERRMAEHQMDPEPYQWYLDLRRYGSVPHSGFGIGLERTVAWICGLEHVRETAPFARLMTRIYP